MNIIRTYNSQNEMLYEEHFTTAEEAYAEYCDCIRLLKAKLPKGHKITVTRWRYGTIMTMETIEGTK